jgi:uncharacterized membrane protein
MRAAGSADRFERLDALRGAAIVWMAGFHLCFDLNQAGFISQDFYEDPWWTTQRSAIVSLFVFCVGLSQAVALDQGQGSARFWKRWAQVAGCALLVSAGSWFMFPRSYISFGVLHGIALILLVLRLAAPVRGWLWPLGALALLMPLWVAHPFFDTRATNWVGLVTHKPVTEDYLPVLPWLGVALWGLAAGQWALRQRRDWLGDALPAGLRVAGRPLAWLGQRSLLFYMAHQPVLIALVMAAAWVLHRSP